MRKTKIVCTLGPATDREGVLRQMLEAGMNVARFNFSHGSHAEHKGRLDALKALRAELGLPVAAMLDTKGPEVRLKSFAAGSVMLRTGQEFTLTTRDIGVRTYGRSQGPPDYAHFASCTQIWAKTFSCMEYMMGEGFIERSERDGIIYWKAL